MLPCLTTTELWDMRHTRTLQEQEEKEKQTTEVSKVVSSHSKDRLML